MDLDTRIAELKKAGHRVFRVTAAGIETTYRSINRKEFRDIQKKIAEKTDIFNKANPDASEHQKQVHASMMKEEAEEMIVLKSVVHPPMNTELDLLNVPAGFIASISEQCMAASGFNDTNEPKEL